MWSKGNESVCTKKIPERAPVCAWELEWSQPEKISQTISDIHDLPQTLDELADEELAGVNNCRSFE